MGLLSKSISMEFFSYLYINFVRLFKITDLYQPTYNAHNLRLLRKDSIRRASDDRINAIKNNVDLEKIKTYLDIGSQLGYFVFKLADVGKLLMSHGIEMDEVAYKYSNALTFLNKTKNVSFTNTKINSGFVKNMPSYDLVSFLNVFHHIVHFEGFEEADRIMRELYEKTNHYFIFETGQVNEKGYYWSESLKFMGDNPEDWMSEYLKDLGYRNVKLVDRFETHLNKEKRAFFVCEK